MFEQKTWQSWALLLENIVTAPVKAYTVLSYIVSRLARPCSTSFVMVEQIEKYSSGGNMSVRQCLGQRGAKEQEKDGCVRCIGTLACCFWQGLGGVRDGIGVLIDQQVLSVKHCFKQAETGSGGVSKYQRNHRKEAGKIRLNSAMGCCLHTWWHHFEP